MLILDLALVIALILVSGIYLMAIKNLYKERDLEEQRFKKGIELNRIQCDREVKDREAAIAKEAKAIGERNALAYIKERVDDGELIVTVVKH